MNCSRPVALAVFEFDHLVEEQKPFGRYVTGTFASPVIDLKDGHGSYPEWLRGTYPGLAKTTLKKERRLGRDLGEMRFVFDERDPRVLRTLMQWKSAQYRRTGRMDRFARPWIVDLVDHLFQVREEHFTGLLSVVYAGDRPVAAHFGPRSRTVFAPWFTAYDPELRYYSPGLIMHLRMAEAASRHGARLMDMGRGDKEWKDWLKTRELRVAEGFATRPHPVAAAHRLWRRPVRGLRNTVIAHPGLREPADRLLKTVGALRTPRTGRVPAGRAPAPPERPPRRTASALPDSPPSHALFPREPGSPSTEDQTRTLRPRRGVTMPYGARLAATMTRRLGRECVYTPSARLALYLALRHWCRPGARVLMSPVTDDVILFVVLAAGLRPVQAPVSSGDGNIDPAAVPESTWRNVDAVLTTNLYGDPGPGRRTARPLRAVGDPPVRGRGARHRQEVDGQPIGTFGKAAAFSLSKHVAAMAGGFLAVEDAPHPAGAGGAARRTPHTPPPELRPDATRTIEPTLPSIGMTFIMIPLAPSFSWISGGGCSTIWPLGISGSSRRGPRRSVVLKRSPLIEIGRDDYRCAV